MDDACARPDFLARDHATQKPSALATEVSALFEQHHAPLFRYLLFLGLRAQDSEEVIQEVFLALFQHLKNEKSRANLRGWIFRVAHNQAMRLYREPATLEASLLERQLDPEPNPEQQAVTNQRQRRLSAVVRALPDQDRACLSLRAEGFRYREIAEILGMSLASISLSLSRSLAKLERAQ